MIFLLDFEMRWTIGGISSASSYGTMGLPSWCLSEPPLASLEAYSQGLFFLASKSFAPPPQPGPKVLPRPGKGALRNKCEVPTPERRPHRLTMYLQRATFD